MTRDVNAIVAGLLRDLAFIQTSPQKSFGYRRAASVVFELEQPLDRLLHADGTLTKIAGLGPASSRIAREVLETGESATVDAAIAASGRTADVGQRRHLRHGFLSRAQALVVLGDSTLAGPARSQYRGDLQVHSEWSDGSPTIEALADAGLARGYAYIGVTDHSHGLRIAGGMSMQDVAEQHAEIDRVNRAYAGRFRIIKGIEANISADGPLDLSREEVTVFELVLAAPHAKLRRTEDQTARMLHAVAVPGVHVLAHPRGRISGTRAGVVADWDRVFRAAVTSQVAIEIDGDPARQDLDHVMVEGALSAGCLFALDSDAHTTDQLAYVDIALAHARLAGIPPARIINCWPTDVLLSWLRNKSPLKKPKTQRRSKP